METFRADMQTMALYSELLEQLEIFEGRRSVATLKGNFAIKGGYVYLQYYAPGGTLKQLYVGKEGPNTEKLMEAFAGGRAAEAEFEVILTRLGEQVRAGFSTRSNGPMMRVLRSLADAGVFRAGGVLVGTHAFETIGTMLGTRWFGSIFTEDVDVATVALPDLEADIPKTIDALQMGFFPVPGLNPKHPTTRFAVRGSKLRLDILTPKTQESEDPVPIKRFGCAAQPLPYLGYLIENPVHAVMLDKVPILVNVPQPARFACHKLIVSQVREVSSHGKAAKDLHQAYMLMSFLQQERPADLDQAWEIMVAKGPKWRRYAMAALKSIKRIYGFVPELAGVEL